VDGAGYEGFDGYFPLILSTRLVDSLTNGVIVTGFGEREPALVLQSDGLWLRLIAPPALSARLCSLVPESTVATDWSNTTFSATRELQPTVSAWTPTFNEAHVQDTTLSQIAADSSVRSWELRTGRGGFIYSLRTPALGETVPPSWRSSINTSPWNDEVWQGVAVGPLNDPDNGSPYFMHQSGVYLKDPVLTEPFYSPQVAAHLDADDRSFTTINWTPQAHINIYTDDNPTNDWKSYILSFARCRDLGQGVIEISLGYYNYGPDGVNWLNMPWGGVRRTSTEYAFTAQPGGTTWSDPVTNKWGSVTSFNLTGGWQGYCANSNGTTPALGFVYGLDPVTLLPQQIASSSFRCGYAGGTFSTNEATWRNYFVTTAVRRYNLLQGHGVWSRYYFVLGDNLQDLSDRIAARALIGTELVAFDYTESSTPLIGYSVSGSGSDFQCLENGRSPDFFLYAHPVTGSFPVFEVIESDRSRYLTWNPYANGIVKPYDRTLAGMRLLGFALSAAGTAYTDEALDTFLPAENYFSDGETLYARTATPIETWRVEHFGTPDNQGDAADLADPDQDGQNNLCEYALGGFPLLGKNDDPGAAGFPSFGQRGADLFQGLELLYSRRRDAAARGLRYELKGATNLMSSGWSTNGISEVGAGTLDDDFEMVTNRIVLGDTGFVRLNIELEE
jgi:hypothetical protein